MRKGRVTYRIRTKTYKDAFGLAYTLNHHYPDQVGRASVSRYFPWTPSALDCFLEISTSVSIKTLKEIMATLDSADMMIQTIAPSHLFTGHYEEKPKEIPLPDNVLFLKAK